MDFTRHDTTRFCKVIGQLGTLYWNGIDGVLSYLKKEVISGRHCLKKKSYRRNLYF